MNIEKCPKCFDILVEHPLVPGSDGTGGYIMFCESCGYSYVLWGDLNESWKKIRNYRTS